MSPVVSAIVGDARRSRASVAAWSTPSRNRTKITLGPTTPLVVAARAYPGTSVASTIAPTPSDVYAPCTTPIVGSVAVPTIRNVCFAAPSPMVTVSPTCLPSFRSVSEPNTTSWADSIERPSRIGGCTLAPGVTPSSGTLVPSSSSVPKNAPAQASTLGSRSSTLCATSRRAFP